MNVAPQNPTFFARCVGLCHARTTPHAGFTDEHGCEVGSACLYCRTFSSKRPCSYTAEMPMDWRDDPEQREQFEAEMARRGLLAR